MIDRILTKKVKELISLFPIVSVTGPRQSGKTTLLRNIFPDYSYVSLETPDIREFAINDPRNFILTYSNKVIIDEAQRVPNLFSYLQTHVDEINKPGMYILSGSQNFLLMQQITQSLAGRVAILKLLPFSRTELKMASLLPADIDHEIFYGSYPRLYDVTIPPTDYYPNYIQTYVERDVRQLKNIGDLSLFIRFLKLCAGRIGQLLNMSSLANDCGIAVSTAQSWLSVLETSYIIHLLRPDHKNFNKRLVKSPKLYFFDTGLACNLLEIKEPSQVHNHYIRGNLFENYIINEFVKRAYNSGDEPNLSFWRDNKGNEIDLIHSQENTQSAYEIKSGMTLSPDYFKGLTYWAQLSQSDTEHLSVIYCGNNSFSTSNGNLLSYKDL